MNDAKRLRKNIIDELDLSTDSLMTLASDNDIIKELQTELNLAKRKLKTAETIIRNNETTKKNFCSVYDN